MAECESISLRGFIDEFRRVHATVLDQQFLFFLGAGASRSSGIKTGGELARDWLEQLYYMDPAHEQTRYNDWLVSGNHGIANLDANDPAGSYGDIYSRRFHHNPPSAFNYLIQEMKDASPSFGYSVLAQILANERHKAVITTNFDNLVEQALALYTRTLPLVVSHESSASSFQRPLVRPLVVKAHRDLLMDPQNRRSETAKLDRKYGEAVKSLLRRHTPIFIGYGGNDGSIMGLLEELEDSWMSSGMMWCYRAQDGLPSKRIQDVVARHNGRLVAIGGFDELMVSLNAVLEYKLLDQQILERAKERHKLYVSQATSAVPSSKPADSSPTGVTVTIRGPVAMGSSKAAEPAVESTTAAADLTRTIRREDEDELRWWQWDTLANAESDPLEADKIYRRGIKKLPDSAELVTNYALFVHTTLGDEKRSAELYEKAIEMAPNDADLLGNYAIFLQTVRKDMERAEALYQRAIEADPAHANNLLNFALFKADVRGDIAGADELFTRAVAADPQNASILLSYAIFLASARRDATAYFEQAIAADPENAAALVHYAIFLSDSETHRDPDRAAQLYERAIAAEPKNAAVLVNYAIFLGANRGEIDRAAGLYERAIALVPNDAETLGSYAVFLARTKNDPDYAERLFARAIEADPANDPDVLGQFAVFLAELRRDDDRAREMFERSISADPANANNLANYAWFKLARGEAGPGLALVDQALGLLKNARPAPTALECWFYAFAHGPLENRHEALKQIRALIRIGVRSKNWDLQPNVDRAIRDGHPDRDWLPRLSSVISDQLPPSSLDAWPAWVAAEDVSSGATSDSGVSPD